MRLKEPILVYFKDAPYSNKTKSILKFLNTHLSQPYVVKYPNNLSGFISSLKTQRAEGGTAIICSGDGMLHYSLEYLADSTIDLFPLPGGTANDLSRELGWCPLPKSKVEIAHERIDCLKLNGKLFVTIAGTGIGSEVLLLLDKIRDKKKNRKFTAIFGKWIYAGFSLLKVMKSGRRLFSFKIYAGNSIKREGYTNALYICNQKKLAGMFSISKSAKNNDGKIEIAIAKNASSFQRIIRGIRSVLLKENLMVETYEFTDPHTIEVQAQNNQEVCFFADGEILPISKNGTYEISILPKALSIVKRI